MDIHALAKIEPDNLGLDELQRLACEVLSEHRPLLKLNFDHLRVIEQLQSTTESGLRAGLWKVRGAARAALKTGSELAAPAVKPVEVRSNERHRRARALRASNGGPLGRSLSASEARSRSKGKGGKKKVS